MNIGHLRTGITPWQNSLIEVHAIALHLWKDRNLGWNPASSENKSFSTAFLWAQISPRIWCDICRTADPGSAGACWAAGDGEKTPGNWDCTITHLQPHTGEPILGETALNELILPLWEVHNWGYPWVCCPQSSSLWFAPEVSVSSDCLLPGNTLKQTAWGGLAEGTTSG